ncbi:MAG: insulinase family protein [Pseudorhodoferax sp.]
MSAALLIPFRLFLSILACLCTAALAATPAPVAERDGIREHRLANGLRIVLAPDGAQQNVFFNLVVLAGSLADPEGKGGTAHLLEHMAFKGTPQRSGAQLVDGLRARGIAFNATTSHDRTRYTAVLDGDPAKLDWLLALEAERMAALRLEQAALEAERSVVLREMEKVQDEPFQALSHAMLAAATPGRGLGRHVLGTREELAAIGLDDLHRFHAAHYRPDNAVLVLTGGFDPGAALAAAQRHLGALQASGQAQPAPRAALVPPVAPAHGEVRRGNTELLALAYPLPPAQDPANVALAALADIFAGEPHGRLYRALVQPGRAQGVLALQQGFAQGGFYLFGAVAPPGQPPQALQAALAGALESLAREPVTEDELRRAQAGSRALQDRLRRDPAALAELLSEGAGLGDWQLLLRRFDQFSALELPAVQRAAEQVLVPDRRLTGVLLAGAAPTPTPTPTPVAAVAPAAGRAPEPAATAGGLSEAVDVAAFNRQIQALERGIQRSRLDNGLQIALRPQPGSGKPAQGMLVLRFGDLDSLRGQRALADLTGTVLIRGTRERGYQQIVDRARTLGAGISVVPQGQSVTVRFEAPPQNLPAVLDLVAEVLHKPAFAQAEIDQVKRNWQQALGRPVEQPAAVAALQMRRLVQPFAADDIRRQPEPAELAAAAAGITREDVVRFHARFYGAGDGALALAGDIDAPAVLRQVQALFGG